MRVLRSRSHRIAWSVALLVTAICAPARVSEAQTFPERPLKLIVPFAAGGAADTTGRIMADAMGKHLGQAIVVENIGGAGGAIGSQRGKTAKPDGYTLGLGHMGTHAAAVGTTPDLGYDPRKDFDYLGIVSTTPNILFVRKNFPANSLAEFVAYAKAKGKILKMGHSGVGAASHITCVLLFQLIGAAPTYVGYRGFGQTINGILSEEIDGSCDLVASVSGHVQAGSVKAFAVATPERSPVIADVPTAKEAGMPEFAAETWTGLYVPKGLPAGALAKLREAVAKSLADPAVEQRFLTIGATVPKPERRGGEAMQKLVETEVDRWVDILKKAGLPEK